MLLINFCAFRTEGQKGMNLIMNKKIHIGMRARGVRLNGIVGKIMKRLLSMVRNMQKLVTGCIQNMQLIECNQVENDLLLAMQ